MSGLLNGINGKRIRCREKGRLDGGCEEDTVGRESDLWIMWRRMDDERNKDVEK